MTQGRFILRWVAALALTALVGCTSSPGRADAAGDADAAVEEDAATPAQPPPLITEFLAKNQSGMTDEDGATSDWIEIYNPGALPFDLSGHHLTDSKTSPKRWAFPAGTVLDPGAYLLVFASGKNRAVAGQPLHTSFSLASQDPDACARKGAGYLALTSPGGALLSPAWDLYPAQAADVSYGRLAPAAESQPAFFTTPTPGAANDATSAPAERVTFDPPSQTFAAGETLPIRLDVASPSATIRYTTNRARPIGVPGLAGTFTADADTDRCAMPAHGLRSGDLVRVSGPAPLASTANYFAIVIDADTFQLGVAPGGPPINLTASGAFDLSRDAATGTAAVTGVFTTPRPHTFYSGDPVQVRTTGTWPAELTPDTTYYVVVSSPTTFRLATSPTLTPLVVITKASPDPLTVFRLPSPIYAGLIPVTLNTRIRARAFEPGRPPGPISGEIYFALDPAAQAFTSNLPVILSHNYNAAMTNNTVVDSAIMIFEPRPPDNLTRLTGAPELAASCTLERHGSSTGGDPKFAMALEMQDEDGIDQNCRPLGMPANSDWLMHAPYKFDRAMLRNDLTYRLSNEAGRYAVRTRLVEHIHNEQSLADTFEGAVTGVDYFGVYSFMEKIKRGTDRVDIEDLTLADNALPALQGGYIFKADRLDPGEVGLTPLPGQSFGGVSGNILAWVNPREISADPFKVVTPAQRDWLRAYLGQAWATLSGPGSTDPVTGYARYWDTAAIIDHHLLNIATKNPDAFALSAYWHKPRFGKITAGPVWDFDRTQGSTDGRDWDWGTWPGSGGRDFFAYPWYREMFADPNFFQAWIDRLHELRQGPLSTANVHAHIDELVGQLNPGDAKDAPAKRSIARWSATVPRQSANNTPITNNLFDGTYMGEVAWLKYWWEQRLAFMDSQVTRPAVPDLPPGPVPAGSLVTLTSPSEALPGVKIYYTTDGTDPRAPAPGPLLSPSAIEYTGPIPIQAPTSLFVRAWNPAPTAPIRSGFSAPTLLSYTPR